MGKIQWKRIAKKTVARKTVARIVAEEARFRLRIAQHCGLRGKKGQEEMHVTIRKQVSS